MTARPVTKHQRDAGRDDHKSRDPAPIAHPKCLKELVSTFQNTEYLPPVAVKSSISALGVFEGYGSTFGGDPASASGRSFSGGTQSCR